MTSVIVDKAKYGPWALIAGASDGVGAAFAEAVARNGINVVLLARRAELLNQLAQDIQSRTGVETRVLVTDLGAADATESIVTATAGLDIGLLVYCAGADADFTHFLENSIAASERMLQRNCLIPMQLSHQFGQAMVERGRGGIVILSAGSAFVGAPNMAVYGATKAFDMIFAESLWAELRGQSVDALAVVLGETDTPSLRRLREERGLAGPNEPIPGATTAEEVVDAAFKTLGKNPTCMAGKQIRWAARLICPIPRGVLVRLTERVIRRAMGSDDKSSA
ncbi:SDR family NAD(P)-dependent oxidoreductase [Mycobacterium sp.]|uniref:SDR family NAD(P)-dependent oxidoreductase n=1 Tax=Mycobacterium sp. TaxID=1785 RepID=UPI002D81B31A|nr:SDR family NAD(P)-dependent oxidoreductase [Mycobacterium sp.]